MGDIEIFEGESLQDDLSILEEDPQEFPAVTPCDAVSFPHPLYRIILEYSNESLYGTHPSLSISKNDYVIIPTRYGNDVGLVDGPVSTPVGISPDDVVKIIRKASSDDLRKIADFKAKEIQAFDICRQKIEDHKLDMKLVSTHYLLEDPKVLFFFSADNRVDFRELVKDLVSVFKMRIELRQIGVRDESRITGGLGVCGRPFCCHSVTDKLRPVSIRMAKDQNLSLNSMKISGQCGRLLCCLAYEHDWYTDERKVLPSEGIRLYYDNCNFKVTEVHPITESVRIQGEDGRVLEIPASQLSKQDGRWRIKPNDSIRKS